MKANKWDAGLYDKFNIQRAQPSIDLVNRLDGNHFNKIIDIGCGSGMSTAALANKFVNAEIIGVDLSADMLASAAKKLPDVQFIARDCSTTPSDLGKFDLIFSNAFMQWIGGHEKFISDCFDMLNDGGIFAAQIPLFNLMPARQCIKDAEKVLPLDVICNFQDKFTILTPDRYYTVLSSLSKWVQMWTSDYYHEMDGAKAIAEFLKGTALRPYIDILDSDNLNKFMSALIDNLSVAYPSLSNNKTLFPFKRLFLIAKKFFNQDFIILL